MTNEDYKKLNDYLNKSCINLTKNDSFLLNNIRLLTILNDKCYFHIKDYNTDATICHNKLTYEEIINITRKIINMINPNWVVIYDRLIDTGELDFSYNSEYHGSHMRYTEDRKEININREFSYEDVVVLVHEFTHYIANNKTFNENYYLLTEFFAIISEFIAKTYLLGFECIPINEIDINFRLRDLKHNSYCFYKYELSLLAFQCFGDLNENTYELLNQYFLKIDKETFLNECKAVLALYEKNEKDINEMLSNDYRYVLGTLLALYCYKNRKVKDVIQLCDNFNNEKYQNMNVYEILNSIGIDIYSKEFYDDITDSIDNYFNLDKQTNKTK